MFDGSSIEDLPESKNPTVFKARFNSFVIFPWHSHHGRVARLICDVYTRSKNRLPATRAMFCVRRLNRRRIWVRLQRGAGVRILPLPHGYGRQPTLRTQDKAGYFDWGPADIGDAARREICIALEDMGFEIEASHHEVAVGQHEIDFKYAEALAAADNIMTFKLAVKTLAQRNGLHATFMPKPVFGIAGSGMHVNMSLFQGTKNAFVDESDPMGLSKVAYSFIAGLLEHAEGITAITNPLVNSYSVSWSAMRRRATLLVWQKTQPLIRIPASRGNSTRIELRSPDRAAIPTCGLPCVLPRGWTE